MLGMAILAGGLATRLGPITEVVPKSLVEIGRRPFIDWQLRLLSRSGIEKIVICLGHKSEMIQDFVGDGARYGINVVYSLDGPIQLGTGGAIRKPCPCSVMNLWSCTEILTFRPISEQLRAPFALLGSLH